MGLDVPAMVEAATLFQGERDFASFYSPTPDNRNRTKTVRTLTRVQVNDRVPYFPQTWIRGPPRILGPPKTAEYDLSGNQTYDFLLNISS